MSASYFTLEPGIVVLDRFGQRVGRVKRVLVADPSSFDGIVISTPAGDRFVDAPEVRRIAPDAVTLAIAATDVETPGPLGPPGPRHIHGVPHDRVEVLESDRREAIARLKQAFVDDRLDIDELERRVATVQRASQLGELDTALADLV